MKELPILFSGAMVRALLAGTKTQTRRVVKGVKHIPSWGSAVGRTGGAWMYGSPAALGLTDRGDNWGVILDDDHLRRMCTREAYGWGARSGCPYGVAGDHLWVKETYFAWGLWETRFSAKKGRDEWHFVDMTLESGKAYLHPATDPQPQPMGGKRHKGGVTPTWWKRPAIFMPRAASRISLEVTEVRVERLQDISEVDALAEGIVQLGDGGYGLPAGEHYHAADPRQSYFSLWEEINGPGSVESDPWVWAVSFKVVKGGGL